MCVCITTEHLCSGELLMFFTQMFYARKELSDKISVTTNYKLMRR